MDTETIMASVRAAIAARQKNGQSIPKIAEELGVDATTVWRWTNEERNHYGRHLKVIVALVALAHEGTSYDHAA